MRARLWAVVCAACAALSAQAIQVADSLVVDLDVADLSLSDGSYVRSWENPGTAGGVFTNLIAGKGPLFQSNVGGVPAVTFQAYNCDSIMTNTLPVPASICGTDTWSWETWVYNPYLSGAEVPFTWTARNLWPVAAQGACMEFRYGSDTGNAVEHYGNNVPWYTAPMPNQPPPIGGWHHVACTRDAQGRERLFLDGQLKAFTSPLVMRIRSDAFFTLGAARDYAYTNTNLGQAWQYGFSGSLAKLRIHDGTLKDSDVVANYLEERAAFGQTIVPDSVWGGSVSEALAWEDAANWGGTLPSSDRRTVIASGTTSVLTTAVGDIGRFLPQHGGLVLSNSAFMLASPWQPGGQHVYMGNYSNNVFNLFIKEGTFAALDYTNGNHVYFGVNRGQAYGVIGGGDAPAVLDSGRDLQIGVGDGSVARMTIEDGGELYTSNGWIYVGVSGIADAKLTVNGGFVGHRMTGKDLVVGHAKAYGVLEINGGVVAPSQDVQLTRDMTDSRCTGILQMNGGLLLARRIYPEETNQGTNLVYLNGGLIRNRFTETKFLQDMDWTYVQNGGARFDVLSNTTITVNQPLLEDPASTGGGLTKSGNGTLILGGPSTFTGDIDVQAGLLALSNSAALPPGYAGSVSVSAGASVGYVKPGGVAALLPLIDTASAGNLVLFSMNATEAVDLSAYPNLGLAFANTYGTFTYSGTYTPYNGQYIFAPQTAGSIYSPGISGTSSVTVNGVLGGVLELTGDNSYTGGTTINGGMLSMGHVNALGDPATVTIPDIGIYNGAALKLNAVGIPESIVSRIKPDSVGYLILGAAYTNFNVNLAGLPGIRVGTDQGNLYYNGTITPEGDVYRTGGGFGAYASGNYGLVLTNLFDDGATARTLVIDGLGMVRPSGTYNNYSGGTIVSNNGALNLQNDGGLGKVPTTKDPDNIYVNKGVFRPGGNFTVNANRGLTVGPDGMILHQWGGYTTTMLGDMHGVGAITNTDSGTFVVGGTSNTYSGSLTLNTGTINLGNGSNFSWNTNAFINGVDGTLRVNYNGDLVWSEAIGGPLGRGGWPFVNFNKSGTGTLTLDVKQFYTRTTTIDNGVLKIGPTGALPTGHNVGNVQLNNLNYQPAGKLDVNGQNIQVNALNGSGTVTNSAGTPATLAVGDNNQNLTYNGKVDPSVTVVKVGNGSMMLNKGVQIKDLSLVTGQHWLWHGAEATGTVSASAVTVVNVGTNNAVEAGGLLGEYYDFSNTALRWIPHITNFYSLARVTEVLKPYAPTIAINSWAVSNVFSFGEGGAFFQNKGDYRVGRWTGKFWAQTDGTYAFDTKSDDGSMVWVNNTLVVSNDFNQGYNTVNPKMLFPITLTAGWHDIIVAYFNGTGGYGLTVFMTPPGGVKSELPQTLLRPSSVSVGRLTGNTNAVVQLVSPSATLTMAPDTDAAYDGILRGTNTFNMLEKLGPAVQTVKRVSFEGVADVNEGTLALQGSPMLGGAVQKISGMVEVSPGATLSARAFAPDWPNAGLAASFYNVPGYNNWFSTLTTITNTYFTRIPDMLAGTYYSGPYFTFNPNTRFPPPYNSGAFNDFQIMFQGKFVAREAGAYGFYLNSDDRTDLYLDSIQVITNAVSGTPKSGTVYLTAGTHDFFVPFQQGGGGYNIYMNCMEPGGTNGTLPNVLLRPCVAEVGPLNAQAGSAVSLPDAGSFLRLNQTTNTVAAGEFSGAIGSEVEKNGPFRLTLTGDNEAGYQGNWFVSQNELWVGDGATSGTLGGSNVYISGGAALVFNRSDDITYIGALAGKGTIRNEGSGKLTLTGNAAAFQGTLQIGAGQDIVLTHSLVATNALVNNSGNFTLRGALASASASRITGAGETRLEDNGTLVMGLADTDFGNTLSVSNGVLALAVTNGAAAWQIDHLTIEAGTTLEVCASGLNGRFYDLPGGDAGVILSNAFLTFTSVTNYFAAKTPSQTWSTWLQGEGFEFGADATGTNGTALFPGKYRNLPNIANNNFGALWQGKIRIVEPGSYTFTTTSDDGSMIFIDGAVVVNNAGSHGMQTRTGTVSLSAGLHDITLCFQQGGGGFGLNATVLLPYETAARRIPNTMLVSAAADTPAYTLTVDAIAVTNGPGAGTIAFSGPGTLKLTDLWADSGARLAVTGSVAVAGSALNVTVPEEVPYGTTVVGDFTATAGLDLSGVTQTLTGSEGTLKYANKLLYIGRSSGTLLLLQ